MPTNPSGADIMVKILIADDHEIVREGIRRLLTESRPDWEICGEAANGRQAVEAVNNLHPDVVVLDVTMPGMSGLEACARISKQNPGCRILIFTVHDSHRMSTEIRNVGGHGYVQKSRAAGDLIVAIERVMEGGTFFDDPGRA
jgi:two-component system invasion response regulator UvrY